MTSLGYGKHQYHPKAAGYGQIDPENLPPAKVQGCVTTNHQSHRRTKRAGKPIHSHRASTSFRLHISLILPPVLVKGAPPTKPPINRHTRIVPILLANATGNWNMKSTNQEATYTGCLPKYSDSGARSTGPTTKPSTYSDSASVMISADTLNSFWIASAPDEIEPAHQQVSTFNMLIR